MTIDYVVPNKNEQEFIDMAIELGYKELVFLYNLKDFKITKFDTKLKIDFGIICNSNEIAKAKNKSKIVVVKCNDNVRQIIEKSPSLIYGMEDHNNSDFIHHKNSGLNQVLAKLMATKKVSYAVNFNDLIKGDRVKLFSRIKFNIKLCKKYKVNIIIASFANNSYKMKGKKDMFLV